MTRFSARLLAYGLVCAAICLQSSHIGAQTTAYKLAWDGATTGIKGYAVTIDSVRTDYGMTPLPSSTSCGCSIPLPFSGGTHTIVVSAYNSQGESASAPLNVAPIANPGGPYIGQVGTSLAVDGSGSNHPAGTIVQWTWNWGDGGTTTASSSGASHSYAAAGTFTIKLTVKDNAGATASASTTATISSTTTPTAAKTVVLWASNVPPAAIHGNWTRMADASAAGGASLGTADRGAAKISPALGSPTNYFDTTFTANADTTYHLWVRMRAQNNVYSNDSIHVQFSDSIDASGGAVLRIGTTSSAVVVLQDGSSGPALHGWGWADNGWGTVGVNIVFASTGTHTLRIQQREDGALVDQIVLSPDSYLSKPPGARSDDATILPYTEGTPPSSTLGPYTTVLWAAHVPLTNLHGAWRLTTDASAAGGAALWNPDVGAAKISPALASPTTFFETTFTATAGVAYHVWLRMRAQSNSSANDSVHVQFSGSVTASGSATMRIGSTSSAQFVLQDGSTGAAPSGWGWTENGWGSLGPDIYFATTGTHTIRVQQREDGALIDQIVISGDTYRTAAPGVRRNDSTVIAEHRGS